MGLALLGPMEFYIKLHTTKSEWSIVYIDGSLKIVLVLANSAYNMR